MYRKYRLYIPIVLVLSVAMTIMTIIDYRRSHALLYASLMENQIATARKVAGLLNVSIMRSQETAHVYANIPMVLDVLRRGPEHAPRVYEDISTILKKSAELRQDIDNIIIFDTKGNVVLSAYDRTMNVAHRGYFQKAIQGHAHVDSIISQVTGKRLIFYVTPITDEGGIVGVAYVAFSTESFMSVWNEFVNRDIGGIIRIIAEDGRILLSSVSDNEDVTFINELAVSATLDTHKEDPVGFTQHNRQRIGLWLPIKGTPWKVIISLDTEQAFTPLDNLFHGAILVNILLALLVLAVVGFMLQKLIDQVRMMEERSKEHLLKAKAKLETMVEERTAVLRTMFDTIPDHIFFKSSDGVYIDCNQAVCTTFGRMYQDIIGKTDAEIFRDEPALLEKFVNTDNDVIESRQPIVMQEVIVTATGETMPMETIKTPCFDSNGVLLGVLGISRNIAQRLAYEESMQRAREQAQAASQAKSEFIANMSHEIRTPMNGIMGLAHLALQNPDISPQLRDYLTKIDVSAKSLLRIINDILDFSKIEAGKLEMETIHFHLTEVLENTIQPMLPKIMEQGLEVFFDLEKSIPDDLLGDPTRLGQILMNLVSNSLKFTHRGHIVIKVEQTQQTEDSITLCFAVTDTGIGIEPAYLSRLFDSFTQADSSITRRYGGTGLGLTICKSLVQLMGGELTVQSAVGQGTTFTFTAVFGFSKDIRDMQKLEGDLLDTTILVVDDNELSRRILRTYLENFGAQVDEAIDGPAAIALFNERHTKGAPYYAVVLDWKMPDMDGVEVAKRIRAISTQAALPIIMVTAYDRDQVSKSATEAGINDILSKPITPSNLHDALLRAAHANIPQIVQTLENMPEIHDNHTGPLSGKKALLAEDNDINQLIAVELLASFGMQVQVANNGREAVACASAGDFDVILMDIQMPEMDGIEATKQLRTDVRLNDIPIIAMTAHAMTGDYEKSLRAGMQAHITKPINPEELYRTLLHWVSA